MVPKHLISIEPLPAVAIAAMAVAYLVGVRALRERGRAWPLKRTVAFMVGVATLAIATLSWLAYYDTTYFSSHVVQHLLLSMAAPILIALGAPVTLLLQASSRPVQTQILSILHSRIVRFVTHPVVTWLLFVTTLFVLYFTSLYGLSLRNETFHEFVHVHFFVSGFLFFAPVIAIDPYPWRMPHGLRLLYVGLTLPAHAFLALALMSATKPLEADFYAAATGWGPARILYDQEIGAGIMWASGDLIAIATVAVVAVQWSRLEDRVATREDKYVDLLNAENGRNANTPTPFH